MSRKPEYRYSTVSRRIHRDAKFRRLSKPQPNGQTLFMWLLTCAEQSPIPGIICIGEAAAAEALGWPLEGFRQAFAEVSGKAFPQALPEGFTPPFGHPSADLGSTSDEALAKADWEARMVWIPNRIKHAPPQSPNVIKSWRHTWDEVPECALKDEAFRTLDAWAKAKGKAWVEAMRKAFGKPSGKALGKPSSNQEQEQEQEQESNCAPSPRASKHVGTKAEGKLPNPDVARLRDVYVAEFERARGVPPEFGKQWGRAVKALGGILDVASFNQASAIIRRAFADKWTRENRCQPWEILADLNKHRGRSGDVQGSDEDPEAAVARIGAQAERVRKLNESQASLPAIGTGGRVPAIGNGGT